GVGVRPGLACRLRREVGRGALGRPSPRPRDVRRGRLREVRVSTDVSADLGYTKSEIMIAASARGLAGAKNCFVGVGLPNIVCNLAQRTVSPDLQLVYESGVFGARPERLPLSIGDPTLVTGATAVTSMFELFAYYLQAGLIDVAFLGAAQIDRFGNINTTMIGDYASSKVHHRVTLKLEAEQSGWAPRVAEDLSETPAPSLEELRLIREELDPLGTYTK